MKVMKFGGTSVSSKENINRIKEIILQNKEASVVVVSALSGVTNLLEQLAERAVSEDVSDIMSQLKSRHMELIHEIFEISNQSNVIIEVQKKLNQLEAIYTGVNILNELSDRTKAKICSHGEQLSSLILFHYFQQEGVDINLLDSRDLIVANGDYLHGDVNFEITNKNIKTALSNKNYIAPGFIAVNNKGETVTLGRGGSDYSASIYAGAIHASALEIWSDVDGIHRANPNKVKSTESIKHLSYEEAFELAYFGAKVLYPPSVLPVMKEEIPIYLKNTFQPNQLGTVINNQPQNSEDKIKGLSSLSNIAFITVSGVGLAKQKGKARKVFQTLENNNVNVILITQSCSEQSIGIGIDKEDVAIATQAMDKAFEGDILKGTINPTRVINDQCIIAVVGDNMRQKIGLCGQIFGIIGENGINVNAIAQGGSERNISIVIDQKDEEKALNVIHETFFTNSVKDVHLFIAGVGNVGKEFLRIIENQTKLLIDDYNIRLKVIGLANSKHFIIDEDGLELEALSHFKQKGQAYSQFSDYQQTIVSMNLRNSIFIDNTASEQVGNSYVGFLENSISVIACNKIACSSSFENYNGLKKTAKQHNCHFKYETTVGAALPVIKTIQDLTISGDKVKKIQAVISGSLNFIFNEYNDDKLFADVVKTAKADGYTEPNPLIDLSGLDVMRKLLILAREAGYRKELSDISFDSFLPDECSAAKDNDELFSLLVKHESHFRSLFERANKKGKKLKVLASLDEGKMSVKLAEVPPESSFYNLEGKDNVISINTERYPDEPLVIKGAGAGANVTASGVFSDLMSIINR